MKCPKCQEEMQKGFVKPKVGTTEAWGTKFILWSGKIENSIDIVTYRCRECGFLESYAKK